eukprot:gene26179-47416_t
MQLPALSAVTELFKPITWFPPMWAFACGVVASGVSMDGRWLLALVGVALAGPLVCATSQAVNDWYDRHVDAINEPQRPIPSGRIPGHWGLYLAIAWTLVSLAVATALGPWGFGAAALGLLLAWCLLVAPALRTLKTAPAELEKLELQLQQMQAQAQEARALRMAEIHDGRFEADRARAAVEDMADFVAEAVAHVSGGRGTHIAERVGTRSGERHTGEPEEATEKRMGGHAHGDTRETGGHDRGHEIGLW